MSSKNPPNWERPGLLQDSRKTEICKTRVVRCCLRLPSRRWTGNWKEAGDWGLHWEGCVGMDGCTNARLVVKFQPGEVETTDLHFRNSQSLADATFTVLLNMV